MPSTVDQVIDTVMRREEVWALYRDHGTVEAVAEAMKLPRSEVAPIIDKMPRRQVYRRKGTPASVYTRDELLSVLRAAAKVCGEPLTLPAYHKHAPSHGWPSALTVTQMFGTWEAACTQAGVQANKSTGVRKGSYTVEDCLSSLRLCRADLIQTGEIKTHGAPSYDRYNRWARDNHKPSGPTVRSKIGKWSDALSMAYAEGD
jgi:hypothetical protein